MKSRSCFAIICFAIIVFSISSCSKEECSCLKEEEPQGVELGMMKGEVREILGDPHIDQWQNKSGTIIAWVYYEDEQRKNERQGGVSYKADKYIFENGLLIDIQMGIQFP